MKLTKTCAKFLRKHGGTLLAIGASVGVVLTAIETGKATIKAEKLVELNKDVPEYGMKEKVKDCWHFYIPAAVLGAGTIGCIIGSNMLSRKEIASLSAAYVALGKSYQEYRRQVAERIGVEEEEKLRMEAAKETKAEDVQRDKDPSECQDEARVLYFHVRHLPFHAAKFGVSHGAEILVGKRVCHDAQPVLERDIVVHSIPCLQLSAPLQHIAIVFALHRFLGEDTGRCLHSLPFKADFSKPLCHNNLSVISLRSMPSLLARRGFGRAVKFIHPWARSILPF